MASTPDLRGLDPGRSAAKPEERHLDGGALRGEGQRRHGGPPPAWLEPQEKSDFAGPRESRVDKERGAKTELSSFVGLPFLCNKTRPLVCLGYLVVQSSTRAICFPKRTLMVPSCSGVSLRMQRRRTWTCKLEFLNSVAFRGLSMSHVATPLFPSVEQLFQQLVFPSDWASAKNRGYEALS